MFKWVRKNDKKFQFLVTSIILLAILVISTWSSSIESQKTEWLLNETKRTVDFSTDVSTIDKMYLEALIFKDIENVNQLEDCDLNEFVNTKSCQSLNHSLIISESSNYIEEMDYYFLQAEKQSKETLHGFNKKLSILNFIEQILIALAILGHLYIFLFLKEKEM